MERIKVLISWFVLVFTLYAMNIEFRWGMYGGLIVLFILRHRLDNTKGIKQAFSISKSKKLLLLACYVAMSSAFVYLMVGNSELYQFFTSYRALVVILFGLPLLP